MFEWLEKPIREKLCLESNIHISGSSELIIDGCRRIEECNEVFMRLLSGSIYVDIHGYGLRAYDFRTGGLVVRGCIEKIEFEERGKKHEAKTDCKDKRSGEGAP
ncbi:YabP/YqfC family sporulation protein [uncultured Ruminococcus sp.]|jgi:hypothetical protein|uniref:YabP/YqfC family sporulation protein n=1 Tax=uncultured Ruminococcus sp. TaxID=165186 RepID=UPI0026005B35|nr:YabP/YqfC family sporulation protein [uncultured Ruminococcus sp.]